MVATDGETGRDKMSNFFRCDIWGKRNEHPSVGGVSNRKEYERCTVSKKMRGQWSND